MEIRLFTEADIPRILSLFKTVGGNYPRSVSYYRWAHLENPAGPSVIIVAEEAGAIVGHIAHQAISLAGGGVAAFPMQVVVHPKYRGMATTFPLLQRMNEVVDEQFFLGIGFPNSRFVPVMTGLAHWEEKEPILERCVTLGPVDHDAPEAGDPWQEFVYWQRESPLEFHPDLWKRGDSHGGGPGRSDAWFAWRFLDHPTDYYDILLRQSRGVVEEYITTKVYQRTPELRVGHILDAAAPQGEVSGELLSATREYFRYQGCSFVTAWETAPFVSLLLRIGEESADYEPVATNFTFRDTHGRLAGDLERWPASMALSDVY